MLKIQLVKGYQDNKFLQQIINLESKLFNDTFKQIYRIDPQIYYAICINTLTNQVVGYISYKDTDLSHDIIKLGVDVDYRRQNIATNLLNYIFTKDILLEVDTSNTKAVNLYKKLGFKIIKTLPNYYHGQDGYRMLLQFNNK